MGLGIACGAFLKCLFNPTFGQKVLELASNKVEEKVEEEVVQEPASEATISGASLGAIHILSELQKEGRLIDFLEEDLSQYEDDEIGSSVRSIHEGCKKAVDKVLVKEKVLDQEEESTIRVNRNYNSHEMKLSGRVSENFPLKGVLVHPGWKAVSLDLPQRPEASQKILAPAEIEVQ